MNLQDQVVSLELAKKLKELGVKQESLFSWAFLDSKSDWVISVLKPEYHEMLELKTYSAFTVAELGEMLPKVIELKNYFRWGRLINEKLTVYLHMKYDSPHWEVGYEEIDRRFDIKEADARAKMLIYLIENKLIEVNNEIL